MTFIEGKKRGSSPLSAFGVGERKRGRERGRK
jgi:hypothetical protein